MNLSSKQLQALVRELLPTIRAKQREQLESIEQNTKEELKQKVLALGITFEYDALVMSVNIDKAKVFEKLWLHSDWWKAIEASSEDDVVDYIFDKYLKQRFEKLFWKEITSDDIEHELVIATIGAQDVEQLINIVKAKLLGQ